MIIVWFVVIAVVILFAQGRIFRKWALSRLSYDRRFQTRSCFSGEEIELVEQISNMKWLPVPWLRVESLLSTHLRFRRQDNFAVSSGQTYQNHRSFFSLAPYTRITRTHRITPTRRGWYRLNTVTLTGGDVLGGSYSSMQLPLNDELVVYPKPAAVPIDELPYNSWQGDKSVRRFIVPDPFVVAGSRSYTAGDTFKQVNWKATARTGELQVHQYDYTADRCLMIYLNVEDVEGMWRSVSNESLIECGIQWAAGAAEAALQEGMEVGFAANMPVSGSRESLIMEPNSGHEHLFAIYECMAKLMLERSNPFAELLAHAGQSGYANRDVLVISAYWNDDLERQAERLRYNGNSVAIWLLSEQGKSEQSGEGKSA